MDKMMENNISAERIEGQKVSSEIAMVVILTSLSMLFATLFLGYAVFRVSSDIWPPFGFDRLPLTSPLLSTVFALVGSICFYYFKKAWFNLRFQTARKLYAGVISSALLFILSQFNLWRTLKHNELFSSSGIFGSIIYGFTWIHFGHMILALMLILWITRPIFSSGQNQKIDLRILNIEKFWHFLGIIWLIMFFALFVI